MIVSFTLIKLIACKLIPKQKQNLVESFNRRHTFITRLKEGYQGFTFVLFSVIVCIAFRDYRDWCAQLRGVEMVCVLDRVVNL